MKTNTAHTLLALLLPILLIVSCQKQDPTHTETVTFIVTADPPLKEGEEIYLSGGASQLGNWDSRGVKLKRQENGTWQASRKFAPNTFIEFKITKGEWHKEELEKDGYIPHNKSFLITKDTTVSYTVTNWLDNWKAAGKEPKRKIVGQVTGNVKHYPDFKVKGLESRSVWVWLPPNYESDSTRSYPVLYTHDGQNVFDPKTSTLGYDWRIDEVADSLIRANEIEPIIVVAIACSQKIRGYEYSLEPQGKLYREFLTKQLKPFIDSTYRTIPDRENTAALGSSMGGLVSFLLAWEHPEYYAKVACLSPAFSLRDVYDYTDKIREDTRPKRDIRLYLDNGTFGLEADLQPGIDKTLKVLKERNYDIQWFLAQGETHNEMAWAKRVWRPLKYLFPPKDSTSSP